MIILLSRDRKKMWEENIYRKISVIFSIIFHNYSQWRTQDFVKGGGGVLQVDAGSDAARQTWKSRWAGGGGGGGHFFIFFPQKTRPRGISSYMTDLSDYLTT